MKDDIVEATQKLRKIPIEGRCSNKITRVPNTVLDENQKLSNDAWLVVVKVIKQNPSFNCKGFYLNLFSMCINSESGNSV